MEKPNLEHLLAMKKKVDTEYLLLLIAIEIKKSNQILETVRDDFWRK